MISSRPSTNDLLSTLRPDLHFKLYPRHVHASWGIIDCLPSQLLLLRLLQSSLALCFLKVPSTVISQCQLVLLFCKTK